MIFGEPKPTQEIEAAERDHLAGAVFPTCHAVDRVVGCYAGNYNPDGQPQQPGVRLIDNCSTFAADTGDYFGSFVDGRKNRPLDGNHRGQRDQPRDGESYRQLRSTLLWVASTRLVF